MFKRSIVLALGRVLAHLNREENASDNFIDIVTIVRKNLRLDQLEYTANLFRARRKFKKVFGRISITHITKIMKNTKLMWSKM